MMDIIYQRASRVLIYLGEADERYCNMDTRDIMMHFAVRSTASHPQIIKDIKQDRYPKELGKCNFGQITSRR